MNTFVGLVQPSFTDLDSAQFQQNLHFIANSKGRLRAKADGSFTQIGFLAEKWEAIRELFGRIKRDNPFLLEYRFIQFLQHGLKNHLIEQNEALIQQAYQRIIAQNNKHRNSFELENLIKAISKQHLPVNLRPNIDKELPFSSSYYFNHSDQFEPQSLYDRIWSGKKHSSLNFDSLFNPTVHILIDNIFPESAVEVNKNDPACNSGCILLNHKKVASEKVPKKLEKEFKAAQEHLDQGKNIKWESADIHNCSFPLSSITENDAGIAHAQGRRNQMEDEHIAITIEVLVNDEKRLIPIYGILDGHGGDECAKFLAENLSEFFRVQLEKALKKHPENVDAAIFNTLKRGFAKINEQYRQYGDYNFFAGSTASLVMIIDKALWVANVGDSRTLLCQNGTAIGLSEDADLDYPKYQNDIKKRGGQVKSIFGVRRVNGALAVGRAIGDHYLQVLNPRPKIVKYPLENLLAGNNHLVIACDGLWDVASSNQVAQTVQQLIGKPAQNIASSLVRKAINAGSADNISVLVLPLTPFV